jgi:formylmethanofuran dehydrogenase subunit E
MNGCEEGKSRSIKGLKVSFSEARELHGHTCPGLVMGYKASIRAMKELRPAPGHSLAAVVFEACGCPLDAIKAVTGCSKEAGNLRIVDIKEAAFVFLNEATGDSIRIALLPDFDLDHIDPEWSRLRKRLSSGKATVEEKNRFETINDRVCGEMLKLPDEAVFYIGTVESPRERGTSDNGK